MFYVEVRSARQRAKLRNSTLRVSGKAYSNICTGWAFAPPDPLLATQLRKNFPTSNWAHSKKFNFMSFYQEHRSSFDTPSKNHCFTRTQSLVSTSECSV